MNGTMTNSCQQHLNITLISLCSTFIAINQFRTRRNGRSGKKKSITKFPTVFFTHRTLHSMSYVFLYFCSHTHTRNEQQLIRKQIKSNTKSMLRCQFWSHINNFFYIDDYFTVNSLDSLFFFNYFFFFKNKFLSIASS